MCAIQEKEVRINTVITLKSFKTSQYQQLLFLLTQERETPQSQVYIFKMEASQTTDFSHSSMLTRS